MTSNVNNLSSMTDYYNNVDEKIIFAKQFLSRHNELRRLHGASNLVLSSELITMAREWANKLAEKGHVAFSEISGIGENITVFPAEMSANEIVDHWYNENRKYEFETPGWQAAGANYFTQIVWKSTKEIGVGRAEVNMSFVENQLQNNRIIENHNTNDLLKKNKVVVAFYRPAGNSNRSNQFAINVSPITEIINETLNK
ncbi:SCP domain-containing protein [Meloidogyne graminicola]|uniref:SCP domain-containing protein n=1 Tax=Meloidogyne graminicola TaxID=189291 RepID=A0A8S9ZZ57_9BILA|nr:SCP domain-containing protein [Meloidogyne graminicola]